MMVMHHPLARGRARRRAYPRPRHPRSSTVSSVVWGGADGDAYVRIKMVVFGGHRRL